MLKLVGSQLVKSSTMLHPETQEAGVVCISSDLEVIPIPAKALLLLIAILVHAGRKAKILQAMVCRLMVCLLIVQHTWCNRTRQVAYSKSLLVMLICSLRSLEVRMAELSFSVPLEVL